MPKYIGCDNPKGKKMKNLCNSSIQESILDYTADKIKNYEDRVPQGKTYLTLSVSKTGEIHKITYSDFNNEKFAKFC
ncbi:MAG: hypothetical protein KIG88_09205, partial [Weeksellaceae bacterium]|nr:hypothetical protein [Weeksellaceae bacterium]